MSLKFETGTLTAPGGTGNQTYNLVDSAFGTVKALFLWTVSNTSDGDVDGDGIFTMGMGTYRGGTASQFSTALFDTDAVAPSDCARVTSDSVILEGPDSATPGLGFEAVLVSLGDAQFTLDWTDAPATAIKVNYVALGGDAITDALATSVDVTTAAGTQDITVASGFGNPDLILAMSRVGPADQTTNGNAPFGLGVGLKKGGSAHSSFVTRSGRDPSEVGSHQTNSLIANLNNPTSMNSEYELVAATAWPSDGFTINKLTPVAGGDTPMYYLALRGNFSAEVGFGQAPTGAAPVVQDLPLGGAARGAVFFHDVLPANSGIVSSGSGLGVFGIGALDGSHEAWAAVGSVDDVSPTEASRHQSTTKAIRMIPDGTLESEADGSLSGYNVRLTWGDTDSVAREYGYLLLGDPPGAAVAWLGA